MNEDLEQFLSDLAAIKAAAGADSISDQGVLNIMHQYQTWKHNNLHSRQEFEAREEQLRDMGGVAGWLETQTLTEGKKS